MQREIRVSIKRTFSVGIVVVLALLVAACSSEDLTVRRQGGFTRVATPRPPIFLTGPASVLLTNGAGFSARVEVLTEGSPAGGRNSAGELLGRGTKLFYAPESDESADPRRQRGGYSFIWDVAANQGYVLSEALQAYAPISSDLRVTNVTIDAGQAAAQRFSGHLCEPATATARTTDGAAAEFELLRAKDLNGLALRIQASTKANPFTLSFSKLHLEAPPDNVFSPPDGFAKYASPEAMADELAARERNLHRKNREQIDPSYGLEHGRY
jgi:hypothetical protein